MLIRGRKKIDTRPSASHRIVYNLCPTSCKRKVALLLIFKLSQEKSKTSGHTSREAVALICLVLAGREREG